MEVLLLLVEQYGPTVILFVFSLWFTKRMSNSMSQNSDASTKLVESMAGVQTAMTNIANIGLERQQEHDTHTRSLFSEIRILSTAQAELSTRWDEYKRGSELLIENLRGQLTITERALSYEKESNGKKIEALEHKLETEQVNARSLEKRISDTDKRLIELDTDARIAREEVKRYKIELESSKSENQTLRERRDAQDKVIAEQSEKIEALASEISQLRIEVQLLSSNSPKEETTA